MLSNARRAWWICGPYKSWKIPALPKRRRNRSREMVEGVGVEFLKVICVWKFPGKKFIYNENEVENRPKWWIFLRKSWILVQIRNLKLALIFRKLFSRFLILEKQHYQTKLLCLFQKQNIHKFQCFKEVYKLMLGRTHCSAGPRAGRGLDSPVLNNISFFASIVKFLKGS